MTYLEENLDSVDEEENDNDEHKECVTTVEDVGDVKVVWRSPLRVTNTNTCSSYICISKVIFVQSRG